MIVTVASNKKERRIHFRTSLQQAGDLGHRNSRPTTTTEVQNPGGEEDTRQEKLRAIPGKKSGLINRCQMGVQLIQNRIGGKKRKNVKSK